MTTASDLSIAEIEWRSRQPENINFLRPNGFRFLISRLPTVTYFCQTANIPAVSLGVATQTTPFVDVPYPGEKLNFSELTIRFMIQEDMVNYIELFNWMVGIGFPVSREQFAAMSEEQRFRFPFVNKNTWTGESSDCTLLILNANNNVSGRLNFQDAFPISLSGLDFTTTENSPQHLQGSATFRFTSFTIESITP